MATTNPEPKKIVLIAGGTGGLGRAVTLEFLRSGATVVVSYLRLAEFDQLKSEAGPNAASLEGQQTDVTNLDAAKELVTGIVARHSRLDALVNTVGGYAGGVALWETDPRIFDRMLDVNLRSGFALSRAAVPIMLTQGSGSIVNIAAKAAFDHAAGAAAYAASKAAAVAMMDCLAADLKGTGVRANSVLPSIIDTDANRKAMPGADFSKWPKPEAIARIIAFLCSEAATLIHGAAIPVYGRT